MSDRKEQSRAIPVPPPPTSQSSRARNSVEGFNTEIEKLVWGGNEVTSNKVSPISRRPFYSFLKSLILSMTIFQMEPTPDGHRAPIAELFKHNTCRSVDTQTPVTAYSTNSSSGKKKKRKEEKTRFQKNLKVLIRHWILNNRDLLGASSPCGSVSPWGTFDHHHSSRPPSGGTVEEIGMYQITFPSLVPFPLTSIYSFQLVTARTFISVGCI